jgi:hypothetical protein
MCEPPPQIQKLSSQPSKQTPKQQCAAFKSCTGQLYLTIISARPTNKDNLYYNCDQCHNSQCTHCKHWALDHGFDDVSNVINLMTDVRAEVITSKLNYCHSCIQCNQWLLRETRFCEIYGYKRTLVDENGNRVKTNEEFWPCPGCKVMVQKEEEDSCNHMTCTNCDTHWCWSCRHNLGKGKEHETFQNHLKVCTSTQKNICISKQ